MTLLMLISAALNIILGVDVTRRTRAPRVATRDEVARMRARLYQ